MTRVLVVDDDSSIAQMLVDFLTMSGYQAVSEPNGLRALQHVDLRPPDLIILDLMLPVVTGVEVARRVRLAPDSRDIPILVISGVGELNDLAEILMVDAILPKPFDLDDFGQRVAQLLARDNRQPPETSGLEVVTGPALD